MSGQTIFVFGSNLSGRRGKGAALYARPHHGAIYGKGVGLQGSSFAIPTKDHALRPMPLDQIAHYVGQFIKFVASRHEWLTLTLCPSSSDGHFPSDGRPVSLSPPSSARSSAEARDSRPSLP